VREATVRVPDSSFEALDIGGLLSLYRAAGLREVTELSCRGDGGLLVVRTAQPLDRERLRDLAAVDRNAPVVCEPSVDDKGATLSLVGPQAALAERLATYEAAGIALGLRGLDDYDGRPGPLAALTARQREVLRTAHRLGYYAVPREASTDEVADVLGLDDSTVAEHLQRAERNLLDRLFE
jgi:DNA-binding CsgD family transcriptional regulator